MRDMYVVTCRICTCTCSYRCIHKSLKACSISCETSAFYIVRVFVNTDMQWGWFFKHWDCNKGLCTALYVPTMQIMANINWRGPSNNIPSDFSEHEAIWGELKLLPYFTNYISTRWTVTCKVIVISGLNHDMNIIICIRYPNSYIYMYVGGHEKHGCRQATDHNKQPFKALSASFAPF